MQFSQSRKPDATLAVLFLIYKEIIQMSQALDQAVNDITTAVFSAVGVMQAAADAIKNSSDPTVAAAAAALEAEAQNLSGATSALQGAIPASTTTPSSTGSTSTPTA